MNLTEALKGLKLNPLDDYLYQGIRRTLASISTSDEKLAPLQDILNRLETGDLKFTALEQALDNLPIDSFADIRFLFSENEGISKKKEDTIDLRLLPTFLDEVDEHIEVLSDALSSIDSSQLQKMDFNHLFRAAHTIKGSAASVGLHRLSTCIHGFEELLSLQREKLTIEPSHYQAIEAFVKILTRSIPLLKRNNFEAIPYDLLVSLNTIILAGESVPVAAQTEIELFLSSSNLSSNNTLKIPAQRVNALFSEVERLQSMLTDMDRIVQAVAREGHLSQPHLRKMNDLLSAKRLLINQVQKELISFRLVPFRQLLPRLRRVVGDYIQSSGKEIELIVVGELVEIKKSIIDKLADILLHVIKNSMDHGLEGIQERVSFGKPTQGQIRLTAAVARSQVMITVEDDGRGIDPEKLVRKAIEKGLLSAREAEKLSHQQSIQLIFMPGFSTAERITAFSGRGVGMDAVRSMIKDLGGTLTIKSEVGLGSRIDLCFPADVSVEEIILVEAGAQTYAILLSLVEAIVGLTYEDWVSLQSYPYYETSTDLIPVVDLPLILHSDNKPAPREALLLIENSGQRVAVMIERVVRKDQVIVSPPPHAYASARHITGIFTLDDGSLCSIIHPLDLFARVQTPKKEWPHAA